MILDLGKTTKYGGCTPYMNRTMEDEMLEEDCSNRDRGGLEMGLGAIVVGLGAIYPKPMLMVFGYLSQR